MRLPDNPNKYTSQFKYVEVAHYVPDLNKVVREKKDGQPLLIPIEEVHKYSDRNKNTGIYTSVFQYNGDDFADAAYLGPMYFDLDSSDLQVSFAETNRLVSYLLQSIPESAIRVYFSGGKGFHVECEPIALGISTTDDLGGIFRFMGRSISTELELTTTDFAVYDVRRMWRLPNSRHQRTGLFKVECMRLLRETESVDAILEWAVRPRPVEVPEQAFDPTANRWFREFIYKFESEKIHKPGQLDLFSRFLENGAGYIKSIDAQERCLDKFKLFKGCPSVRQLQEKARTNHHLEHYERLFLCSILTYTPDAVQFLHEILSECSDYNFEISNAHVEDWIKRREHDIGGRPFSCEKARAVGITCSGCDTMEPRKRLIPLTEGKFLQSEEETLPSPVRWAYQTKPLAI